MNTIPTLGLDMSLRSFVAGLWFGPQQCLTREFANTLAGFRLLDRWLKTHGAGHPLRIGVEATNTYADALVEWLYQQGHAVFLLNPERTAAYARCLGRRNKTDPADAATIAAYVAHHECTPWEPPSPEQKALRSLTRARQQLTETATQLSNQLRTATGGGRAALEVVLRTVRSQIAELLRQIREHLHRWPVLLKQLRHLVTLKGMGLVTAAVLIAELPRITAQTDPRTICGWAGLTPRRWQSGQTEWRSRLSRKGNAYIRQALYMPALVAKRWNPLFKDYAARLAAKGKTHPAILGALSHKMLRIAVGLLRTDSDFIPNWQYQKN
jgi:transposase